MEEVLEVKLREGRGSSHARRLRRSGSTPAVLYGHGEETLNLSVSTDALDTVIRHGTRVVELSGGVKQTALIRDVQWDAFGIEVLHVDFTRVSATEVVEVTVMIELRGEAPGIREGGVVEQPVHEVDVELPAAKMVDRLQLSINDLHLDGQLTVADLELPEGGKVVADPDLVIVQCVEPKPELEEEEGVELGAAEPEVIGQSSDEEESAE